jgi:23S rRNA (uracil1939-C5)-methyltransferase
MTAPVAEIEIERLAAGGDGVGRAEGVVVFVPRTAPGDRVRARLELRKRFARGTVDTILAPSPDRVEAPCSHYDLDRCGGCQIQHLAYPAQLLAKSRIIRDALARIGKREIAAPSVEASDRQWRYRRKLTLAMRRRRDGWVIGLHPYDDPVAVFQLVDCPITDERVVAIWREVMSAHAFFPDVDELRASVRLGEGGATIVMEGGHRWEHRSAFFDAVPSAAALWWRPPHRPRMLVATRSATRAGASFAQVNPGVGAALHAYVLACVRAHRPSSAIDAYAGAGSTAIPLAHEGIRVTAIEVDRDAVAACSAQLPPGSQAVAGRVEDVLPRALPADVVILNPPRTGLNERVPLELQRVASAPRAIVYVSCDPATLARDLARMPRYRVSSVHAFDMFPQTAHVETVCELIPESA